MLLPFIGISQFLCFFIRLYGRFMIKNNITTNYWHHYSNVDISVLKQNAESPIFGQTTLWPCLHFVNLSKDDSNQMWLPLWRQWIVFHPSTAVTAVNMKLWYSRSEINIAYFTENKWCFEINAMFYFFHRNPCISHGIYPGALPFLYYHSAGVQYYGKKNIQVHVVQ